MCSRQRHSERDWTSRASSRCIAVRGIQHQRADERRYYSGPGKPPHIPRHSQLSCSKGYRSQGTYDCSREAARFGFSFPPSDTVHYIDAEANVLNRTADGKICTANILGTSTVAPGEWSIGQTWFQGRYVQHDLDKNMVAFADLA